MSSDSPAVVRTHNTRAQILRAAYACLLAVGFEKITTRRIAQAAGVNVATLHYYFGTKERLLSAAVDDVIAQSEEALRAATEGAPNAAAALAAGIETTWRRIREQPGILRYDLVVRGFRDEEARERSLAIYEVYRRLTCAVIDRHVADGGILREGLTPDQLAVFINAATDGVILRFALTRDEDAARRGLNLIQANARYLMGIESGASTDEPTGF